MRYRRRHRVRQMALVMVAAPAAAWALEQAARRAEARDKTSAAGRRLRQGADLVQRFGRGRWPTGWDGDQPLPQPGPHSNRRRLSSMAVSRRPQRWTSSLTDSLTACGLVALSREAGVPMERNGRSAWPVGANAAARPPGAAAAVGSGGAVGVWR
jgi:hypothetical protein